MAVRRAGALYAGGRQPDIGAERAAHPVGERARRFGRGERRAVERPEPLRRAAGGGDQRAAERRAGARRRRQARAHQPAGQRLRHRQGLAARAQHVEHRRLHRLVVDAEHHVAENAAHARLLRRDDGLGGGLVRRLGGDAHLEALYAARLERQRRRAGAVELGDAPRQLFGESGLGLPPGLDHAALDDRRRPRPPPEVRQDRRLQHQAHFPRHAGNRVGDLLADGADQPRRRPRHFGDERRAFGQVGLAQVVPGHPPPARFEHPADARAHRVVADEFHAHHAGEGLARDVVLRRAEAAAADHGVAALEGEPDAPDHALEVVADFGLEMGVDAGEREPFADPARIGVDDLAEQQLGPDRHDLAPHDASALPPPGGLIAARAPAGNRAGGLFRLTPAASRLRRRWRRRSAP